MKGDRPLVLDATVLSNFASSDSVDWLAQSVNEPVVPVAVRNELHRGVHAGHDFLQRAADVCDRPLVRVVRTSVTSEKETDPYTATLDQGEAAALVHATDVGGVLATDDGVARREARSRSVALTGSIGLLVRGVVTDSLDIERAQRWFQTWVEERGYYAPVDSVREALPDEFDQDRR